MRGVWLALFVAALCFVGRFGDDIPRRDDLDLSPIFTGQNLTLDWLWRQHNEHRLPLPRVVLLGLAKISGRDYLANCFFQVLLLAGLSYACILVVRRLRGRQSPADAVFALLWLHWGHAQNWLMGFQVAVVLPVVIYVLMVLGIALRAELPGRLGLLGLGVGAALLPLCGAMGVVLGLVPAAWLVLAAWTTGRRGDRGRAVAAAVGALLPVVVTALYFVGYHPRPPHETGAGTPIWLTAAAFLSMALGEQGPASWPLWVLVELALVAAAAVGMARLAAREPAERLRLAGVALGVLGIVALGLAIGVGRTGAGPGGAYNEGFARRYVVLATPLVGLAYVGACLAAPPRLGTAVRWGLLLIVLCALPRNFAFGIRKGMAEHRDAATLVRDVLAGDSSREIALHHHKWMMDDLPRLTERLTKLRLAGVGPFRLESWKVNPDQLTPEVDDWGSTAFFMFEAKPTAWETGNRQGPCVVEDGLDAYLLMPDGALTFDVPDSARWIRGRYGMAREAWERYGSDGARFRIETVGPDGSPRVLLDRYLDPVTVEADRGPQTFDLVLPADVGSRIVLRTSNLPDHTGRGDAPYWTGVAFR